MRPFIILVVMYYFYVLYSLKDGRLYKGSTADLPKRLLQHNAGRTPSTQHRRPFILLYFELFDDKTEALRRERWAKSLNPDYALENLFRAETPVNTGTCSILVLIVEMTTLPGQNLALAPVYFGLYNSHDDS